MHPSRYFFNRGVSLVEFVLGLAILAIVLVGVGLFFLSQPRQLDPVFQFRAVSLAEALTEQIWSVKYDTSNNPETQQRCGITPGAPLCDNTYQASTANINSFTVVDDFNLLCDANAINGEQLAEQLNLPAKHLYQKFTVATCVVLTNDGANDFKKVEIKVTINQGSTLSFELHRYNIR